MGVRIRKACNHRTPQCSANCMRVTRVGRGQASAALGRTRDRNLRPCESEVRIWSRTTGVAQAFRSADKIGHFRELQRRNMCLDEGVSQGARTNTCRSLHLPIDVRDGRHDDVHDLHDGRVRGGCRDHGNSCDQIPQVCFPKSPFLSPSK